MILGSIVGSPTRVETRRQVGEGEFVLCIGREDWEALRLRLHRHQVILVSLARRLAALAMF